MQADELRCPECTQNRPLYRRAAAYGSYEGSLRGLVRLLKYERVRPAAEVLGHLLSNTVAVLLASGELSLPIVIPVPLHPARQRQRGFNQSELVARAMLNSLKGQGLTFDARALKRRRPTESQTGLTREQRGLNVRGAFVVAKPRSIADRDVLLVDDVFTTGTTVSECARVLTRAGARAVWAVTVARVLDPGTRKPAVPDSFGNTSYELEDEREQEGAPSLH
jgi:ComF family protein